MEQQLERVFQYFPNLSDKQRNQFAGLKAIYETWNARVNVISRKDIDQFYERHVLHSLSIARVHKFAVTAEPVLDIGTGGGFPGIPLAILFPETPFVLVDSIGKKIAVIQEVVNSIGLTNVTAIHGRAESQRGFYQCAISRAVAPLPELCNFCTAPGIIIPELICLKGGDLKEEIRLTPFRVQVQAISSFFREEFFETKQILRVNLLVRRKVKPA